MKSNIFSGILKNIKSHKSNDSNLFDIYNSSARTPNEIASLIHKFPEYVFPVKDGQIFDDIEFVKKLLIDELTIKSKLERPFNNLFDEIKIYTAPFPNRSKVAGITSNDGKSIYLREGLSRESLIQAAIHELTHSADITLSRLGIAAEHSMLEYPLYSRILNDNSRLNISSYTPIREKLMYQSPEEMQMLINRGNFTSDFIKTHQKIHDLFEVHANASQEKALISLDNNYATGKQLQEIMEKIPAEKYLEYKTRTGGYGKDIINHMTKMGISLEEQARLEKEALLNVADYA